MNDPDSYGLYCTMVLQEHQQYGASSDTVDPSVVEACQRFLNSNELNYN